MDKWKAKCKVFNVSHSKISSFAITIIIDLIIANWAKGSRMLTVEEKMENCQLAA